jgi:hypothetical protein
MDRGAGLPMHGRAFSQPPALLIESERLLAGPLDMKDTEAAIKAVVNCVRNPPDTLRTDGNISFRNCQGEFLNGTLSDAGVRRRGPMQSAQSRRINTYARSDLLSRRGKSKGLSIAWRCPLNKSGEDGTILPDCR